MSPSRRRSRTSSSPRRLTRGWPRRAGGPTSATISTSRSPTWSRSARPTPAPDPAGQGPDGAAVADLPVGPRGGPLAGDQHPAHLTSRVGGDPRPGHTADLQPSLGSAPARSVTVISTEERWSSPWRSEREKERSERQDIPSSGSRWEPTDDAATGAPDPPRWRRRRCPAGRRGAAPAPASPAAGARVAAAGVGLVLAGGLGGFAIGHAIDGTEASDPGTVTDSASTASRTARTARAAAVRTSTATAPCQAAGAGPAPATARPRRRRRRHRVSVMTAPSRPALPAPAGLPVHRHRRDAAVRLVAVAAAVDLAAARHVLVGDRGRRPGPRGLGHRADLGRPAHRTARVGPAAGAGAAHGPRAGRSSARSGRTGWPATTASSASPRST